MLLTLQVHSQGFCVQHTIFFHARYFFVLPNHIKTYINLISGMPKSSEVPPEEYLLEENEERSMIEPKSYENPKLKDLIRFVNTHLDMFRLNSCIQYSHRMGQ